MIRSRQYKPDSESIAIKSAVDAGAKIYFLSLANCIAFAMLSFMLSYVYRDFVVAISVLIISILNLYVFMKR